MVFVAMSGGVDSSVAAALLKKDGYDTVGVFMKCWDAERPSNPAQRGGNAERPLRGGNVADLFGRSCTAPDDERSARLAAEHLGIPFYSWNFVKEYKARVADYMLEGYRKGITPNPDVMCNKEIKFGLFFEKAMALGADYVATGHYARLRRESTIHKAQSTNKTPAYAKASAGRQYTIHKSSSFVRLRRTSEDRQSPEQDGPALLEGKDKNKDQSYFLGFIKPEILDKVLFPIGDYIKPQVRELARKFRLPNAERKESQGVCFVGKLDFSEFLRAYIREEPGPIKDIHGSVIGKHQGLSLYTIGQRKGIGLSGGPYYVVGKDEKTSTLLVSKNEDDLLSSKAVVRGINWFLPEPPTNAMELQAKIRYRQKLAPATLTPIANDPGTYELEFKEPQRAITPGQFAVLYDGEVLLGSGIIQ